jgi:hypothetical protein
MCNAPCPYLTTHENSSGSFVSGSEDETGTLDFIEKKIAKATMIPQSHGEVFSCCYNVLFFFWLFFGAGIHRVVIIIM